MESLTWKKGRLNINQQHWEVLIPITQVMTWNDNHTMKFMIIPYYVHQLATIKILVFEFHVFFFSLVQHPLPFNILADFGNDFGKSTPVLKMVQWVPKLFFTLSLYSFVPDLFYHIPYFDWFGYNEPWTSYIMGQWVSEVLVWIKPVWCGCRNHTKMQKNKLWLGDDRLAGSPVQNTRTEPDGQKKIWPNLSFFFQMNFQVIYIFQFTSKSLNSINLKLLILFIYMKLQKRTKNN